MTPTRRPVIFFLLISLLAISSAPARNEVVSISGPSSAVSAGQAVQIELVVANSGPDALTYRLPAVLDGELARDAKTWPVKVNGAGEMVARSGSFARRTLELMIPPDAEGRVVLTLREPQLLHAVIDVRRLGQDESAPSRAAVSSGSESGQDNGSSTRFAATRFKHYYADHFSAHEPMYFIYGGPGPAAKFQFSFKYRVLNDNGPLAETVPALRGLHVAYTQRSLWDIKADSSPFHDSSYMPELLYQSMTPDKGLHTGFNWIGYQAGVQHESNGRSGAFSRSMNTVYIRPVMLLGDPDGWRLILLPKFLAYVDPLDDNPDLKRYRGYSELRAIIGQANRLSISLTGRVGDRFDKGSLQIDASYPTEFLTGNFALYLHLQHWTGYGESLLDYGRRSTSTRLGFSLAR